jgi:hypothetical protein
MTPPQRIALLDEVAFLVMGEPDRICRPQNRSEKASWFQACGSRGVKDRRPSKSRTPPNPKTSDDHTPAAEAIWTPSGA